MSPALNESSTIQRLKHSNAIEIRDRITFDFDTGLPHIRTLLISFSAVLHKRESGVVSAFFLLAWVGVALVGYESSIRLHTEFDYYYICIWCKTIFWTKSEVKKQTKKNNFFHGLFSAIPGDNVCHSQAFINHIMHAAGWAARNSNFQTQLIRSRPCPMSQEMSCAQTPPLTRRKGVWLQYDIPLDSWGA